MSQYKELFNELEAQSSQNGPTNIKEPSWLMRITKEQDVYLTGSKNDLAVGEDEDMKNFSPILEHQFAITRGMTQTFSKSLRTDGGITGHDLKVVAVSSSIATGVTNAFINNSHLMGVELIRVAYSGGGDTPKYTMLEKYHFKTVFVTGILNKGDITCVSFRYASFERAMLIVDPLDGTTKGSDVASGHNLVTGSPAADAS